MSPDDITGVEERVRAATRARTDLITNTRPLEFGDLAAPVREPSTGRHWFTRSGWSGWLVPLTAAAAVIAIAGILVAVRGTPGTGSAARATSAAASASSSSGAGTYDGIPPYYVAFDYPNNSVHPEITVLDTATHYPQATFKALLKGDWQSVATSASDSTFVVYGGIVAPNKKSVMEVFYKLSVPPGDPRQATLTPLTLAGFSDNSLIGSAAVSPDGRTLALFSAPANADDKVDGPVNTLRTYSLSTGKLLRTWTVPAGGSFEGPDPAFASAGGGVSSVGICGQVCLQWLDDGHTLAWTSSKLNYSGNGIVSELRTLNTDSPGTNLVADSHTLRSLSLLRASCTLPLLTADGKSFICDSDTALVIGSKGCATRQPTLTSYSVSTGKLEHVLYRHEGTCQRASTAPYWAPSGSLVIGMVGEEKTSSSPLTTVVGVMTPTTFTQLAIAGNEFAVF
jgi:hypothetical protein